MNQYKDIHAYYKLIGNNQEPSILLSTLQSTPHTVLYLKNIDQANEEIIHLISKILEEGYDFTSVVGTTVVNNGAVREIQDYALSLDASKNLATVSNGFKTIIALHVAMKEF